MSAHLEQVGTKLQDEFVSDHTVVSQMNKELACVAECEGASGAGKRVVSWAPRKVIFGQPERVEQRTLASSFRATQ